MQNVANDSSLRMWTSMFLHIEAVRKAKSSSSHNAYYREGEQSLGQWLMEY